MTKIYTNEDYNLDAAKHEAEYWIEMVASAKATRRK